MKPNRGGTFRRANLLTSMILVFPLFLVYQVGVLAIPQVYNGADLITSQLLHLLHGRTGLYVLVNAILGVLFLIALAVLRRKNEFHPRQFIPVLIESALYAVTMGSLIVYVMTGILHIDPRLALAPAATATGPGEVGLLGRIVLSFGAGVHEELVFRLIFVTGFTALFEKMFKMRRWVAIVLAFVISAALFSAAHHVVGGEPWRVGVFVYRFLCGIVFATIFQTRGFATAVYTHALYDIFVLTLHA
jgi:hypothetical protein